MGCTNVTHFPNLFCLKRRLTKQQGNMGGVGGFIPTEPGQIFLFSSIFIYIKQIKTYKKFDGPLIILILLKFSAFSQVLQMSTLTNVFKSNGQFFVYSNDIDYICLKKHSKVYILLFKIIISILLNYFNGLVFFSPTMLN